MLTLKGYRGLVLWGSVVATQLSMASAGTFVVFGPQTYIRAEGPPRPALTTFSNGDPTAAYTLRLDSHGISGATVTLNGNAILSPRDFNQTVTLITKSVTLLTANQLTVELNGKPGES